jgi:hypothetical protein
MLLYELQPLLAFSAGGDELPAISAASLVFILGLVLLFTSAGASTCVFPFFFAT